MRKPAVIRYLLSISLLCSLLPGIGHAAPPHANTELLAMDHIGIAVARLENVRLAPPATDAYAVPMASIAILESLRGNVPATVMFIPLLYGTPYYHVATHDEALQWQGRSLEQMKGKTWIFMCDGAEVIEAYPDSPALRAEIRQHMKAAAPATTIMLALALGIAALSFLSMPGARLLGPWLPAGLLLLQGALFTFYEWHMPAISTDRTDLLFLLPALFLNLALVLRFYLLGSHRSKASDAATAQQQ